MQAKLRIRRFNPETDKKPWWGEYTLVDVCLLYTSRCV